VPAPSHPPCVLPACCIHRASRAGQPVSAGALFKTLVYAPRVRTLTRKRAEIPEKLEQWLTAPASSHITDAGRFLSELCAAGGKTQATVNHKTKDGKQTIVPRATQQFLEAMMWSASSQGAREEPPCAMAETLVEGCTKKMMKQAEQAKKCTDAVPPKVRIMLNIAKARAEASNALVTFTTDGRTTAEVAHDTTQPQFKYTVDSSQTGCPRCSCEADRLTDWPCECACVAAHKKGVNDLSVLLNDHDKTPEWQDAYRYFEKKPILYPSTAVVYTEVESDLRLAAYVPIPSGRPSKQRMKSGLELQRERARTNGGFGAASSPAQPNMSSSQGAGPSSATAGSASARKRAPQMCTACGKPRKGHKCTGKG